MTAEVLKLPESSYDEVGGSVNNRSKSAVQRLGICCLRAGRLSSVARLSVAFIILAGSLEVGWTAVLTAVGRIDLMGNNITTDSFDSSSTNYSINGLYPTGHPEMTRDHGDVCTDSSIVDSLNVGNAFIKGHIRTGPGVNTYTIGANGSVGSKGWVEGGNLGIQPGWASTDFNVAFAPVSLPPYATWLPAVQRNDYVNGIRYQYIFDTDGDYVINNLSGSIYVASNVNVRMNITQNVISSTLVIRLSAENARMRLFMQGPTFGLTGQAYIDNASGHADRFYFYGLPSCTNIIFGGNGSFYGCVYAPNADYYLGGGGNTTWDFVGASVTKSVVMNGHFNFHFDESLHTVPCPPAIIQQPQGQAVLLGQNAEFGVSAVGPSLCYQWQTNGVGVPGQTNAILIIPSVTMSDFADYTVLVSNPDGSTLSDVAKLTLAKQPALGSLSFNPTTFTLVFPTERGPTYVVEYALILDPPSWRVLTTLPGTGDPITVTDNNATEGVKFYRVHVQ